MITTDRRTPMVLIQSASGDIWAKGASEEAAVAAFVKAGALPGFRCFVLACDKNAHLNSDRALVVAQRGPIWEARLLPGSRLDYQREVAA